MSCQRFGLVYGSRSATPQWVWSRCLCHLSLASTCLRNPPPLPSAPRAPCPLSPSSPLHYHHRSILCFCHRCTSTNPVEEALISRLTRHTPYAPLPKTRSRPALTLSHHMPRQLAHVTAEHMWLTLTLPSARPRLIAPTATFPASTTPPRFPQGQCHTWFNMHQAAGVSLNALFTCSTFGLAPEDPRSTGVLGVEGLH